MAKTKSANSGGAPKEVEKVPGDIKSFEERLERLEELGDEIRKTDIPLDAAIKAFEEGIKLARALEKDLQKIESKIEILMNGGDNKEDIEGDANGPILGLFDDEE